MSVAYPTKITAFSSAIFNSLSIVDKAPARASYRGQGFVSDNFQLDLADQQTSKRSSA
jgi:hypothetical protein